MIGSIASKKHLYAFVLLCCIGVILFAYMNISDKNDGEAEKIFLLRLEGPLKPDDPQLLKYIRQKFLNPPSDKPYNLSQSQTYKTYTKGPNWKFAYEIITKLFGNEPPGYFFEAGALDGEFLSNSLWLEKEKNWRGVLIEPDPQSYKSLLKKNRKAWSSNSCVSRVPYPEMSILSSIVTTAQNKPVLENRQYWVKKGQTFDVVKGFTNGQLGNYRKTTFTSQCFPLQSYLLALNVTVVDFLSLDMQGGEWEVLKLFPWDKIKIRSMIIEYYASNIPRKYSKEFVKYIEEKGFTLIASSREPDYFFVHSEDKLLEKYKSEQ